MNSLIKAIISIAVMAVYLLLLRHVAPAEDPYFILGIAVVGLISWLCGSIAGLAAALFLVPATNHIYEHIAYTKDPLLQELGGTNNYMSIATTPAYIATQILSAIALGHLRKEKNTRAKKDADLQTANERLRDMLTSVQELGGIHNLCGSCKRIQDEHGRWHAVDVFLKEHTKMEFSHCMCPKCAEHFHDPSNAQESL